MFVFCWKTNQRAVACLCCTSESSCRRSTNGKLQFYVYTSGLWAIVVMHHITRAVPTPWFRAIRVLHSEEWISISILWGVHQCLALRSPGSGWIPYRNSDFIESFLSAEKPKQTGEFSHFGDVSHVLLTLSDLQHSPVFVCWLLSHWSQFEVFLWGLGSTALQI